MIDGRMDGEIIEYNPVPLIKMIENDLKNNENL